VDYFLLRRQQLDIRAVYVSDRTSAYHYWGGVNPAGILALVAGFATYVYLLNPVTYEARDPFRFLSASIPSAVVAGVVFLVLTIFVVRPAGRGGYEQNRSALPERVSS